MALAPIQTLLWPRFRRANRQRVYARQIQETWHTQIQSSYITEISQLRLPIIHSETQKQRTLAQALAHHTRITLTGERGSGRTLGMQQLMVQWSKDEISLPTTLPLYLHINPDNTEPATTLQHTINKAGFEASPLIVERGLAAGHWLLLIDGIDELSPTAAHPWMVWLNKLAERYPALAVVITQSQEQATPAGFEAYQPAAISESLVTQWINQLLPEEEASLICGPLFQDQRLRLLSTRFLDIASLIFMYTSNGFPANRARLLTSMVDRTLRIYGHDVARARSRLAEFGYAVWRDTPYDITTQDHHLLSHFTGLVGITDSQKIHFEQPIFHDLCIALKLAANPELLSTLTLDTQWQRALALASGMMADTEPLYQALMQLPESAERTLVMAHCLREHHVALQPWSAQIITAMLDLAKQQPMYAQEIWQLYDDISDVAQATIANKLSQGEAAEHWVLHTLRNLPIERALPGLFEVVIDSRLLRTTRQVAALDIIQHSHELNIDAFRPLLKEQLDSFGSLLILWILSKHGAQGQTLITTTIAKPNWVFPSAQNATDARLIIEIASSVLQDKRASAVVHTRAAAALQGCVSEHTAPILLQACISASPVLRQIARKTLTTTSQRGLALRALGRLVLGDDVHWAAQYEALCDLIKLQLPGVPLLLERVVRSTMPLVGRIIAAQALLQHEQGETQLIAILKDPHIPESIKTAIIHILRTTTTSNPILLQMAYHQSAFFKTVAVQSLGKQRTDESGATLAGIVEHERSNVPSLLSAIQALGILGEEAGIWALRSILLGDLLSELGQPWEKALDRLTLETSPTQWPVDRLPETLQWQLGKALASGSTAADLPGNLHELLTHEVTALRSAAAQALGKIGGQAARDVLREGLMLASAGDSYGPAPAVASELAQLEMQLGGSGLISSLKSHSAPLIRWVSAYALQANPDIGAQLRESWHQIEFDQETHSMMLTAMGSDPRITPLLETIIVDDNAPMHLRLEAIRSLGKGNAAHAEGLLMAIITSSREQPMLAIEALNVLNGVLSHASLQAIRNILRTPRAYNDVTAAALETLVRVADCESLTVYMRYAQHEHPAIAIPAINGLVLCEDSTATALLSRLAYTSHKSTRIRLQALGGLLKLEGNEHLPSIRHMIEKGSIATRLMALDFLLEHSNKHINELAPMLQQAWPLPLRLRIAQHLANHADSQVLDIFQQYITDQFEHIELQLIALKALSAAEYHPALVYIEDLAQREDTPLMVRKQAIKSLKPWRDELTTALLIGSLAEQHPHIYIRAWALEILLSDNRGSHEGIH